MTNKEELRNEFLEQYGSDTDQMVSAHQHYMPQEVADWWLSKIEQIRKADMERVVNGINNLGYTEYIASHNPFILHPKAIPLDRLKDFLYSLSIIKQAHE